MEYQNFYKIPDSGLTTNRQEVIFINYLVAAILDEAKENPWIDTNIVIDKLYGALANIKPDTDGNYKITAKVIIHNIEKFKIDKLVLVVDYSKYVSSPIKELYERVILQTHLHPIE